ncbi:hypothetical protein [Niallia sp. 01092]|uniref:hypothetical protein n=1 Tax=unclassified Niallia TaxID=2837522 RepID=UPI003FD3CA21
MAKYPYRKLGTQFDRVRNDLNENMIDIESDMKEQKSRVDNIIRNNPQPSEVVDSRVDADGYEHAILKDRLDSDYNNHRVSVYRHKRGSSTFTNSRKS